MTIAAGTRLGRYEIRSKLGEGGMGEVYLALDAELNRTVAIKTLPNELASNEPRLRRFIQEAQAASALNHPHILTIYEIGNAANTRFMATEFIDGDTLTQWIRRGSQKLNEILEIAIQTTSALAAAHAAGIIHRDIKPENIMVRRDGYVKVVDFGLAKLSAPSFTASDSDAPTRALANTREGVVMGTARYMSPEQAKGIDLDARTKCSLVFLRIRYKRRINTIGMPTIARRSLPAITLIASPVRLTMSITIASQYPHSKRRHKPIAVSKQATKTADISKTDQPPI